jgi:hypothetical protein
MHGATMRRQERAETRVRSGYSGMLGATGIDPYLYVLGSTTRLIGIAGELKLLIIQPATIRVEDVRTTVYDATCGKIGQ